MISNINFRFPSLDIATLSTKEFIYSYSGFISSGLLISSIKGLKSTGFFTSLYPLQILTQKCIIIHTTHNNLTIQYNTIFSKYNSSFFAPFL